MYRMEIDALNALVERQNTLIEEQQRTNKLLQELIDSTANQKNGGTKDDSNKQKSTGVRANSKPRK